MSRGLGPASAPAGADAASKYVMTISRLTIDKLGVKLYDRVSAVIAELVANGYDADATEVYVEAPMGAFLASMQAGKVKDSGYSIVVRDNGTGMEPDVINAFYLKVGAERRKDPERGDQSKKFLRKVMGRKGVGKLAHSEFAAPSSLFRRAATRQTGSAPMANRQGVTRPHT
jgi:hypothetical protein